MVVLESEESDSIFERSLSSPSLPHDSFGIDFPLFNAGLIEGIDFI